MWGAVPRGGRADGEAVMHICSLGQRARHLFPTGKTSVLCALGLGKTSHGDLAGGGCRPGEKTPSPAWSDSSVSSPPWIPKTALLLCSVLRTQRKELRETIP